ncbi:6063_t:CDS:1, partial [Dentiscutata heterogama]
LTKANPTKKELILENKLLNERVEQLEEEVETLKNPGTSPLRLILKYPVRHHLQAENPKVDKEQSNSQPPPRKKRKTMPFSQLLTNESSLQQLREAEEEAEKVANEKKHKKEIALEKRMAREAEKMQQQEARRQKKEDVERIRAEKQRTKKSKPT